ncbi:hypothetical protein KRR40_37295 [Niabella defluvii]|nr:hypothetical protein KRR40_37295 [Niabella sp. I65]
MGLNFNGGVSYSPINNEINRLNYNTSAFAVELHKTKFKSYTVYLLGQAGYTVNKSSCNPIPGTITGFILLTHQWIFIS